MSAFSFLEPQSSYPLPQNFDYREYIEIEREMWALFPETDGKRVNFCQLGLTAYVFVESPGRGELAGDETFFLMPCEDSRLHPVRMRSLRRLTLDEFRMGHLTAMKLAELVTFTGSVMEEIHQKILGPCDID